MVTLNLALSLLNVVMFNPWTVLSVQSDVFH